MSRIIFNPERSQRVVVRMVFCASGPVLRAVNVNWNDDGWNVNANSVENPNRWNDGNQVFSRNCYFSPAYFAGVLLWSPFFHPPSMRPISSSIFENSTYLSFEISLCSHANWTKNFKTSSLDMAFAKIIIFCSGGEYEAVKLSSRISINK